MSTNSTNISEPVQVSTVEFSALLCGWFCYCHTGAWTVSQPLRFLVALQGYAKLLFGHFWVRTWEVALSLFASYLLGRVKIDWKRSLMVLLWLGVDTTALVLEILLSGPHATRRAPVKIATAVMEALLAFAVIAYLGQLTLSLKGQGKWIWLSKLVGLAVWSLRWGILSVLYWLQLTTDLPIMVWLMTYAAFSHYSSAPPTHLTGVFCIKDLGDLPYVSMTMSHNLQMRYQVVWTSAFGAAANTFRIKRWQGGMYLPIISAIWRDPTDGFWLPTLQLLDGRVVAIGTHGSPDSSPRSVEVQGHQVSTTTLESSTQTSVTTTSVACQTSDEEQQQPLLLEELLSPISPAEEPMCKDTGPSQLSDGWLNEVMLAIPPQPFSPLSPLPPILSPIHSPVDIVSQEESTVAGSPSPTDSPEGVSVFSPSDAPRLHRRVPDSRRLVPDASTSITRVPGLPGRWRPLLVCL
ncbi:hypothetical protein XENOCAPTIV_026228 [Xenoophorus captivus]|uniref:Transmembrane protein n=1 Tax=Xenoophorus captivus TaxID=1517983 RepID=A0ABV0S0U5_9TELE